jgi:hypothetical protein
MVVTPAEVVVQVGSTRLKAVVSTTRTRWIGILKARAKVSAWGSACSASPLPSSGTTMRT